MKIDRPIVEWSLQHIVSKGDTDVFPYPFELKFLAARAREIASELSSLDVNKHQPMSIIESLVPKTKYGFRIAHQPFPIDSVVFLALVVKIFDDVESGRDPKDNNRAFSYRKVPGLGSGLFAEDRSFKDWIEVLGNQVFSTEYSHAIRTDISDFYSRIYRHRLENILNSLSGDSATVRVIERLLSTWRGRQSFGNPVGGDAARLLAEAALHDTDMALISEGYWHTRYVDDMVILVEKGQDPYAALAFLARHLSENEGLSLNNQKTSIYSWEDFVNSLPEPDPVDDSDKEAWATEKLFWAAYGQDELAPDALSALMLKDLSQELEDELSEPYWDMGAIRIILHAMRLVEDENVARYVRANLPTLVPFAKDVCLLIEHFTQKGVGGFEGVAGEIVDLLLSPRMSPLDCSRAWFLELGVRGVVEFSNTEVRRLEGLSGTLDTRQLHLLRWRANDLNYFRSRKTRVNEIQAWAQPSFIFGARCLPQDEYDHWVRSIKSRLQFPLGKEFAEWCLDTYGGDPLKTV